MQLEICNVKKQYKDKCEMGESFVDAGCLGAFGSKWCREDDTYENDRWHHRHNGRRNTL